MDELQICKASFTGISLGAWLALKQATAHPDMVEKLVLLCPAGISPQRSLLMLYAILLKPFGKWGERKLFTKVMGTKEVPEEALAYSMLIAKNFSPFMGTVPIFSDADLKRLKMPILLIVGEKDIFFHSKMTADRIRSLLPQAKILFLTGAGHGLINQQENILPFLRGAQ